MSVWTRGSIGFRSCLRTGGAEQRTRCQMQMAGEDECALPEVMERSTLCFPLPGLAIALQRLQTRFRVGTDTGVLSSSWA